jgi:autotransporter-associated beta strand protein
LLLVAASSGPVHAQDATWQVNPATGNFNTATNWTPNSVPSGTATFGFTNTPNVSFSAFTTVDAIVFAGGAPAYTLSQSNPALFVEIGANGGAGIVNTSGVQHTFNNGGLLVFQNGTAGDLIINNTGAVTFDNASSAGTATIGNSGGTLSFALNSSAASATITTDNGGLTQFTGSATAGNARLIANTGTVDFSGTTGPNGDGRISAGSIASDPFGVFSLGSNRLTVGSNNESTTVFGRINDGGSLGGTGASLVKVGTGTLTIDSGFGPSNYSGGTFINGGVLAITSGQSLGASSGGLSFDGGTLRTLGLTELTSRPITLNAGGGTADVQAFTQFSGTITGPGSLTKTGSAMLLIDNGGNTYSGGTIINAGELRIGANNALGTGGLTFTGPGLLNLNDFSQTFTTLNGSQGTISNETGAGISVLRVGSGSFGGIIEDTNLGSGFVQLVKEGPGTLVLSGPNRATGDGTTGVRIEGGILRYETFGSVSGDGSRVLVLAGGTAATGFAMDQNFLGKIAPASAGVVALAVDSANALNLGAPGLGAVSLGAVGNATFSGTLTPALNTYRLGGGGGTLTVSSVLGGTASLVVDTNGTTPGTVILTGANTYAGNTAINAGTLQIGNGGTAGSILGNVLNNGALVFNRSDDVVYPGVISGTGSFTKQGAGRLDLTGTSTFTGPTTVAAGTLAVNGSIAASVVTVGNGATLAGNGTVGGIVAGTGAIVAPGNSIGQLNVAGNVAFGPGSTYQVEVNAAGQGDRITATGTATLTGGTVQALASAGNYAPLTRYTILSAAAGLTGQYAGVTSNLAFLVPSLEYDGNNAYLVLSIAQTPGPNPPPPTPSNPTPPTPSNPTPPPGLFASVGQTPNERATADGVQSLGPGNRVYDAVLSRTVPEARQAFNALSGEIHSSLVTAAFEEVDHVRRAILARLFLPAPAAVPIGGVAGASVQAAYAADLPGGRKPQVAAVPAATIDARVFSLWGSGFGSFGSTRQDGNAGTLTRDTSGFVIGGDATIDGMWRIGVAGAYTTSNLDIRSRLSSGENSAGIGAIYGGAGFGPVQVRLGFIGAANSTDTRRTIVFPGFSDVVSASFGGRTFVGFGEVGYRAELGPATVEPFIGGSALRITRDGFTETGGPAALTVAGRDYDIQTFTAGMRGAVSLGDGSPFSGRGMLGYRHAMGDVVPAALLAFAAGGTQFQTAGIPIDVHALVAEAGVDWQATRDVRLGLTYSGQVGGRGQDHGARGSVLWQF